MFKDEIPRNQELPIDAKNNVDVALKYFREGIFRNMNVCFPACVYKPYDPEKKKITVMPLIKYGYLDKDKMKYVRRQPYDVSLREIRCGGFQIHIPLYVGDTGWVIASDRNTTLLKQDGVPTVSVLEKDREDKVLDEEYQAEPGVSDCHEFISGFFIPDNWGTTDWSRYKDSGEAIDKNTTLYIGNSFDTKDDYQEGQTYEKSPSCSILLDRTGKITIAQSGAAGKTKRYLKLDGDGIHLTVKKEGEGGDGEEGEDNGTYSYMDANDNALSLGLKTESGWQRIFLDDNGIKINTESKIKIYAEKTDIYSNVKVHGSLDVDSLQLNGVPVQTGSNGTLYI